MKYSKHVFPGPPELFLCRVQRIDMSNLQTLRDRKMNWVDNAEELSRVCQAWIVRVVDVYFSNTDLSLSCRSILARHVVHFFDRWQECFDPNIGNLTHRVWKIQRMTLAIQRARVRHE